MKKFFFSLALIGAAALIGNEVSTETVRKGAICVTKDGCPICPVKCSTCGKPVIDETEMPEGQEVSDEVKCGCGKPKPGRASGE